MDHARFSNSDTDDDLPTQNPNNFRRGVVLRNNSLRVSIPSRTHMVDMNAQIHELETEAYSAVLKAFNAQSDSLSWGREGLITQLRKELRISDAEHREGLATVDTDEHVRNIRACRQQNGGQQERLTGSMHDFVMGPSTSLVNAHKKLKSSNLSQASTPVYFPRLKASEMPYSLSAQRDNLLKEGVVSNQGTNSQSIKSSGHARQLPVKGRGSLKVQISKNCGALVGEAVRKGAERIEIRETHKIIHQVERIFGLANPDPALEEKARLVLKEHEQSLLEAIAKLDGLTHIDSSPDRPPGMFSPAYPYGAQNAPYASVDRAQGYRREVSDQDKLGKMRMRQIERRREDLD